MHFLFYIVPMTGRKIFALIVLLFFCLNSIAQTDTIPVAIQTIKANREKEYRSLLTIIHNNLSLPLSDSTEENWQDALGAMELLNHRTGFIDSRISHAMDSISGSSTAFQKSMLQVIFSLYSKAFVPQIVSLVKTTDDPKLFAMCCEYLFRNGQKEKYKTVLLKRIEVLRQAAGNVTEIPFFTILKNKLLFDDVKQPPVKDFLAESFLPGEMVVYSFQRKNRDFPGLVMVRGKDGAFIKDAKGKYIAVPQLARSSNNMPGYISNGNTPQGIFKIFGLAVSKNSFIGPTTNIQMVLPYEKSTDVADSVTRLLGDNYRYLLPASWKDHYPAYEAFYAGKAGRTEIIAHGTTVNPAYYKKQACYPLTLTQGCLCTKEIWSSIDGKRIESDQQKLADAVKKTGTGEGYCIVIEIDNQQKPVGLKEIISFLK